MTIKVWNIEQVTGYKPCTTFYEDFSIADKFGLSAIKDTYRRGLKTAKACGKEYLTEFVMVLNWKIWEHHQNNEIYAKTYDDLWRKASEVAENTLKGDDLMYYYRTID